MNTFLRQIKMATVGFFVAVLVVILTVNIASAATDTINERNAAAFNGYYIVANPCAAGWTCQDNNAYSNYLGGLPRLARGTWYPKFLTTIGILWWYPYIPKNGASPINFGAAYYRISDGTGGEIFYTPVNQNRWKGQWVKLGYLSHGSKISYMTLDANATNCVPGYLCNGALKIYYDKVMVVH